MKLHDLLRLEELAKTAEGKDEESPGEEKVRQHREDVKRASDRHADVRSPGDRAKIERAKSRLKSRREKAKEFAANRHKSKESGDVPDWRKELEGNIAKGRKVGQAEAVLEDAIAKGDKPRAEMARRRKAELADRDTGLMDRIAARAKKGATELADKGRGARGRFGDAIAAAKKAKVNAEGKQALESLRGTASNVGDVASTVVEKIKSPEFKKALAKAGKESKTKMAAKKVKSRSVLAGREKPKSYDDMVKRFKESGLRDKLSQSKGTFGGQSAADRLAGYDRTMGRMQGMSPDDIQGNWRAQYLYNRMQQDLLRHNVHQARMGDDPNATQQAQQAYASHVGGTPHHAPGVVAPQPTMMASGQSPVNPVAQTAASQQQPGFGPAVRQRLLSTINTQLQPQQGAAAAPMQPAQPAQPGGAPAFNWHVNYTRNQQQGQNPYGGYAANMFGAAMNQNRIATPGVYNKGLGVGSAQRSEAQMAVKPKGVKPGATDLFKQRKNLGTRPAVQTGTAATG